MKKFKDLGISTKGNFLKGTKMPIHLIFDKTITVQDFRVSESKYKQETEKCLSLQILKDDTQHVVFTGSTVLIDQIQQVPKEEFPFETKIIKREKHFEFS